MKIYSYKWLITFVMVLTIAVVSFLSYRYILNCFFTGMDTFPWIESSRIESMSDVVRIFSEPLNSRTSFSKRISFYRPISTLSFSLDYYMWRLNPFGYQLTNLILHCIVSVLIFYLTLALTNGKKATALLSSFIFISHPILKANLNTIACRQDFLSSMFILLTLLFFKMQLTVSNKKKYLLLLSVIFYIFALGSREIAVILLPLIFILLLSQHLSEKRSIRAGIMKSMLLSLPYLAVTFVFILWRTYVLKGLGGYNNPGHNKELFFIVQTYLMSLVNPYNLNGNILDYVIGFIVNIDYRIILFFFFVLALLNKQIIARVSKKKWTLTKNLQIILVVIMFFSFIGMSAYPLINKWQILYKLLLIMLFLCSLFLLSITTDTIKKFMYSESGQVRVLLLVWLLLPLCTYLSVRLFSTKYMYLPIIPFSMLLSFVFIEDLQAVIKDKQYYVIPGSFINITSNIPRMLKFIILLGIILVLFKNSPLLTQEPVVDINMTTEEPVVDINRAYLLQLIEIVPKLPKDGIVYFNNVPSSLHPMEIESWINLNYPANNMNITISSDIEPGLLPKNFKLDVAEEAQNHVAVNVLFENESDYSLR